MQVLLKQDVEHLGRAGQLLEVKPGYARNYLVPQEKAIYVTRQNAKSIELEMEVYRRKEERRLADLRVQAEKVSQVSCTVACKADENDHLYGSVSGADVASALRVAGFEVDAKAVRIASPIKSVGVYEVEVVLERNISATVKVWVVRE